MDLFAIRMRMGVHQILKFWGYVQFISGWWYTYPSEKYESQLGWLFPIYGKIWKNNKCPKPPTSTIHIHSYMWVSLQIGHPKIPWCHESNFPDYNGLEHSPCLSVFGEVKNCNWEFLLPRHPFGGKSDPSCLKYPMISSWNGWLVIDPHVIHVWWLSSHVGTREPMNINQ